MKIAIIGSGVAGLTSAYLLSPHHEVTLYEKNDRIGGHAHTFQLEEAGQKIAVDNGFMVFNPKQYPHFVELLKALNVASLDTTMSFSVTIPGEVSFRGNFPNGLFADRTNLISKRFIRFVFEITRFRRLAKRALKSNDDQHETLSAFLARHKLSDDLAYWFLYPMLSAIWSIKEAETAGDFPAFATFTFLNNHRLLDNRHPTWRTIRGGSIKYVSKIKKFLDEHKTEIILQAKISKITRQKDAVTIHENGKKQTYDYVLFATHADTTASLISDITADEKRALKKFTYTNNVTILHKDTNLVPKNKRLLAAWNYNQTVAGHSGMPQATFTYCMNILQHIPRSTPVFVTLNPTIEIDKNKIYAVERYSHPQYNLDTLKGQEMIAALQGKRRTLYAGAHLGYGFHEDGVASAVEAVKHLGITPAWLKKK